MTVTSKNIYKWIDEKEQGKRGFPGPPGAVSGGAYPGAGIPLSTGSTWGTSYTTSGTGTVIPLQTSPTLLGTVVIGNGSASNIGITLKGNIANTQSILWEAEDGSDRFNLYANLDATTDNDLLVFRSLTVDNILKLKGAGNVLIGNPSSGVALTLGRYSGQPNIKSSDVYLIADSNTGFAALNYYVADNVLLAGGGGNVGVGYQAASVPLGKLCVNGGLHVGGLTDPGDNNLWIDGNAQEPNFNAGWQGTNWRIEADGDAEFNNVRIRGGLSVYELIINQLHYQNGGLIIGAGAGKIATITTATVGSEVMTFHDPEGNAMVPFTAGSIVMCQRVDISKTVANGYSGDIVKKIVRQVHSVSGMSVTLTTTAGWATGDDTGIFEVGDELCAIGHTTNTDLDSSIYLSATDANNPFMRVLDGVNTYGKFSLGDKSTIKLQLGNLASLASYDILPASPGYGLYCNNVYLTGKMVLPTAGMTDEGSSASDIRIYAGNTYSNRATAPFRVTQNGALTATGIAELGTATQNYGGTNDWNVALKGSDIWENARDADGSTIQVNRIGYNGGTTRYRDFIVYDGKEHKLFQIGGGTNPIAAFGNSADAADMQLNMYGALVMKPRADTTAFSPEEGMIYADTDHHLYYYNGSTWKQLDN